MTPSTNTPPPPCLSSSHTQWYDDLLVAADRFPPYFPRLLEDVHARHAAAIVREREEGLRAATLFRGWSERCDSAGLGEVSRRVAGLGMVPTHSDFHLDSSIDGFPIYGTRRVVMEPGAPFECGEGGLLLRRGTLRLHDDEAKGLIGQDESQMDEWLGGLFLAHGGRQDDFVLKYLGAPRRQTIKTKGGLKLRKRSLACVEKGRSVRQASKGGRSSNSASSIPGARRGEHGGAGGGGSSSSGSSSSSGGGGGGFGRPSNQPSDTHTLQVGSVVYDASDTTLFPNGLLNTQPRGAANTCAWGKLSGSQQHKRRQKNAPAASAQNVFLINDSPPGTLLTVDFGPSFNTAGFVKLACIPQGASLVGLRKRKGAGDKDKRGKGKNRKKAATAKAVPLRLQGGRGGSGARPTDGGGIGRGYSLRRLKTEGCDVCGKVDKEHTILLCDGQDCGGEFHMACLTPINFIRQLSYKFNNLYWKKKI